MRALACCARRRSPVATIHAQMRCCRHALLERHITRVRVRVAAIRVRPPGSRCTHRRGTRETFSFSDKAAVPRPSDGKRGFTRRAPWRAREEGYQYSWNTYGMNEQNEGIQQSKPHSARRNSGYSYFMIDWKWSVMVPTATSRRTRHRKIKVAPPRRRSASLSLVSRLHGYPDGIPTISGLRRDAALRARASGNVNGQCGMGRVMGPLWGRHMSKSQTCAMRDERSK